jgi:hypothetical protein
MPVASPAGRWKRAYGLDPDPPSDPVSNPFITPAAVVVCRTKLKVFST